MICRLACVIWTVKGLRAATGLRTQLTTARDLRRAGPGGGRVLDGVVVTMAEKLDLAGTAGWSSATVETSLLRPGAGRLAGVGPLPRSRPVCRISLPVGPDVLRARREMLAERATMPCRSERTQGAHGGGI